MIVKARKCLNVFGIRIPFPWTFDLEISDDGIPSNEGRSPASSGPVREGQGNPSPAQTSRMAGTEIQKREN